MGHAERQLRGLELQRAGPDRRQQRRAAHDGVENAARHPRFAPSLAARDRRHDVHRHPEAKLRLRPGPRPGRLHQVGVFRPEIPDPETTRRSACCGAQTAAWATPMVASTSSPSTDRCSRSTCSCSLQCATEASSPDAGAPLRRPAAGPMTPRISVPSRRSRPGRGNGKTTGRGRG